MATTRKTTTKAKTNTTKKPASRARTAAAKTSRSTKSTKVTKKSVSKKPAVKAKVLATKTTVLTANTLRKLNILKAFIFAALAAAATFLMNNASYPISVAYQTKDEILAMTTGKTAFVPASQNVLDVEVRWLLVFILALAAVFSLLSATRMRQKFEDTLIDGISSMRWVGWGITSSLMVATVALLSGISNVFVLKLVAGLMLITCALAWVGEKRNKQAGRSVWSEFAIGLVTGSLPWLFIGSYALSTWIWGLIRYPWFVYALYAALLVGFIGLTLNQYKRISGWKNTMIVERNYLLIGLVTKAAFAIILIVGFQK